MDYILWHHILIFSKKDRDFFFFPYCFCIKIHFPCWDQPHIDTKILKYSILLRAPFRHTHRTVREQSHTHTCTHTHTHTLNHTHTHTHTSDHALICPQPPSPPPTFQHTHRLVLEQSQTQLRKCLQLVPKIA